MICLQCSLEIENDSFYCDQCGSEVRVCELCGEPGKGKRCTNDGKFIVGKKDIAGKKNADIAKTPMSSNPSNIPAKKEDLPPVTDNNPVVVLTNQSLGAVLTITEEAVIGRNQGGYTKIFENLKTVSGKHARIYFDKQWMVMDLESTNGTYLDDKKIPSNTGVALAGSARVRFANVEFIVSLPSAAAAKTARL